MAKKILFAAGGTGGHLFPAQGLAHALRKNNSAVELLFAGALLSTNHYFDRSAFPFCDVESKTPFQKGRLKTAWALLKGVCQSVRLLYTFRPQLVVGFGSYHSFPLLCAAWLTRTPLILFESNAIPGKVVRLFSRYALYTAIYFPACKQYLKGSTRDVEIPSHRRRTRHAVQDARKRLDLDPALFTLLVFGGSQGSKAINRAVLEMLPLLREKGIVFQLIHCTGCEKMALEITAFCKTQQIPAYVKKFEEEMDIAWSAADLAICRSGAATLSELIHFEVPSLLIPFPHAADQHQLKNAQFLEKEIEGAEIIEESRLTGKELAFKIAAFSAEKRERMQVKIRSYKNTQKKLDLAQLINKPLA